jgi:hypothetical protein
VVEVGQVAEAARIGDGADRLVSMARVQQHTARVSQALAKHELRERGAFALEQQMDIVRGHTLA